MDEEALSILRMVQAGTVTPEQGAELLAALQGGRPAAAPAAGEKPRFLRVAVNVEEDSDEKVNLAFNLPIGLASLALKIANEAKIQKDGNTVALGDYLKELQGVDLAAVLQMVKDGAEGKLVDINVEDGDEHVKVAVVVD